MKITQIYIKLRFVINVLRGLIPQTTLVIVYRDALFGV